jgi:hypothetical protein
MYAHQVIEDLKYGCFIKRLDLETREYFIRNIKSSLKFHFDDSDGIEEIFDSYIGKNKVFLDRPQYLKFPFHTCWFDYEKQSSNSESNEIINNKFGALVVSKNDEFQFYHFFKNKDTHGLWCPDCLGAIVKIGKKFDDIDGNMKWMEIYKVKGLNVYDYVGKYIACELSFLEMCLNLLNCKNITQDKVYPSNQLNKKRIKHGHHPLFVYHTLVVNPMSENKRSNSEHEPTGIKQRLHFCRGHFKEYTEQNKLFGKHTGLYWWQPMVRGNKELGLVHKDYEVRAA